MTELQHKPPAPTGPQAPVSKEDIKLRNWIARLDGELSGMLERVSALVLQESPTSDSDAVNAAQMMVAGWAEELGGRVTNYAWDGSGGILEVRFGNPEDRRKPVMLLGHLDTVWP